MELENNLNNSNSIELENNQKNFFDGVMGKVVNKALDFGIRAILPDIIENQVINIKNALIENGINDGIKTTVESIMEMGKSFSGIFTGKFENISQVQNAVGSGGIIDTFSDILDKATNKIYEKGIINYNIKSLITKGKNIILNNMTNNIKTELNYQQNSIQYISKYVNNFNNYLSNKDFDGMTKEYNKIKNRMENIIPIENIIKDARKVELIYNLIKNNGKNFNLDNSELELIEKLK